MFRSFSFVKIISLVEGRSVCWFLHQSLTLAPNQGREPPPQARPRHYKPSSYCCHRHKSTQLHKFTSLVRHNILKETNITTGDISKPTIGRPKDGCLIRGSQECQLEWMIDCGRPICLGPGYNMPAGKEGAAQFLKITHRLETPHFLRRSAKGWVLNIGRALFSMWTSGLPEGTLADQKIFRER